MKAEQNRKHFTVYRNQEITSKSRIRETHLERGFEGGKARRQREEDTLKLCSTESLYYGLKVCVPPDSCIEALSPNEMAFGDGAFGK